MSNIILWIVFGGLAGWIATLIVGNDASFGIAGNVVVGIIGAFLGGWIADKLGIGRKPGVERPTSFVSFIVAIIGAIILLILLNLIF
ncbi:MAG: GlsB/YeaQ/YmgE family stress response membrane protein [Patescibacteria group bacterium]